MEKINTEQAELIEIYLDKLVKTYHPKRIWLIGSAARERSDLDFVVESEFPIDPDEVVGAIDVIPFRSLSESMKKSLRREGIEVYERG
ncbi:MAG TPA: hypothetical protein VKA08_02590 [Balneolales bacterium]|nr:hypothetical protein [Balneolales bacterium]